MITHTESRDLEELIPGNKIDHIWGADDHEIDNLEIQDHAKYLGAFGGGGIDEKQTRTKTKSMVESCSPIPRSKPPRHNLLY